MVISFDDQENSSSKAKRLGIGAQGIPQGITVVVRIIGSRLYV